VDKPPCDACGMRKRATSQAETELRAVFDATWARQAGDVATDGVIVGWCRLDPWAPWRAGAAELLDDADRQRAGRMKRARDAEARTLAYALHRLFLGAAMGLDPHLVPLSRDRHGCPLLAQGDWRTSLSHAEGAMAFAACATGPVGIDIEHAGRAADIDGIADEIWHPVEREALSGAPRLRRTQALLETWVRKEAYLKASGTGLREPMSRFALPVGEPRPLDTREGHDERGQVVVTTLLQGLPDHVVALACVPERPVHAMLLEPA
jgi:4'-phosphopantetheinyl transferase